MSYSLAHNIGGYIKVLPGSRPVDTVAATLAGLSIDRLGYESAVLMVTTGAASGSPDSFTVNCKIQHSADDGSLDAYADYAPDGVTTAAITAITANNTTAYKDVDLAGAKRYIKLVPVVAFVSGSTPAIEVATTVVLGGAVQPPVA